MKKLFILFFLVSLSFSQNNLCSKLPNKIDGFLQIGKCNYMKMQSVYANGEQAKKEYKNKDKLIKIILINGSIGFQFLAPYKALTKFETNEILVKTSNYKGFKTIINHNKKDNDGLIIVVLNQKNMYATLLVLNYHKLSPKKAIKLLDYVDFNKLQAVN